MKVAPYLNFNGNAKEAMEHYAKILGGKIEAIMTARGSPMEQYCAPDQLDNVMHACLVVDDFRIMASDAPNDMFKPMAGNYVSLHIDKIEDGERIWKDLSNGAKKVDMELQDTFWAARFGSLTDRYGTNWMINCAPKM